MQPWQWNIEYLNKSKAELVSEIVHLKNKLEKSKGAFETLYHTNKIILASNLELRGEKARLEDKVAELTAPKQEKVYGETAALGLRVSEGDLSEEDVKYIHNCADALHALGYNTVKFLIDGQPFFTSNRE